jgi:precorrin-2/cobalt-factor-2 C20-methyltransferase
MTPLLEHSPDHSGRSTGRLIGVGVGPGDPDQLTRLAVTTLERADRIVAPTTAQDAPGRAETIVRQVLPGHRIHRLAFDMTPDDTPGGSDARTASHTRAAASLVGWLDAGETIAFVTLGDPNVYSTFPSLEEAVRRLRPATDFATVPGICAFQVLAARSGMVLLDGTESLALVTALDGTAHVEEALSDPQRAVVVYKGGRHLPAIAALLAERGRLDNAVFGELLGLPGEQIDAVGARGEGPATYLATVIVPPATRPAPRPSERDAP